jgi:hypothetical protein
MDGAMPPYYRVFEFWFESYEGLQAALGIPEGRAVEDIPSFASGAGIRVCLSRTPVCSRSVPVRGL